MWEGGRGGDTTQYPTEMRYSPNFSVTVAACSGTTGSSYTQTIRAEICTLVSVAELWCTTF